MKEYYDEIGKEFPDLEFIYQYDTASFLEYYSKIISLAGLERLTGVNQGQLSHYLTGKRKPSTKTTQKIQRHLHAFGKELQLFRVCFNILSHITISSLHRAQPKKQVAN